MLLLSSALFALSVSASPLLESRQTSTRFSPAGGNKANWETVGCANDLYPDSRALNGGYLGSNSMTIATCLNFCQSKGQHLAGLENGNQCFCGPQLDNGSKIQVPASGNLATSKCTSNAAGNSNQSGGGPNALLVFASKVDPVPSQATVANTNFLGCFADSESKRILPNVLDGNNSGLTTESCLAKCTAAGYDLCGLEYSTQCFGGSSKSVTLGNTISSTRCEYTCGGNHSQLCGGSGAAAVYKTQPAAAPVAPSPITANGLTYTYQGCYTDRSDSQGRALTGYYASVSDNTNEACVARCANNNFQYAATEYGTECRCGNTLASFSTNTATCDVKCPGAAGEPCGGSNYAMTLYKVSSSATTTKAKST